MNKAAFWAIAAAVFSGCTTHPSIVDSSVNQATPNQFVPASQPDVLERAYEQRVRQRADELYRTKQVASQTEADKKAREELGDRYTPVSEPDSVTAQRAAKVKAKPAMNQKALDAAAEEVARQRSQ
jgi:hypothetical protein